MDGQPSNVDCILLYLVICELGLAAYLKDTRLGTLCWMLCRTEVKFSVAIVLDFIQTLWIFDPSIFCLDFINKCLDFSSLEVCLTFDVYQTMCSLFQNHSMWY